MQRGEKSSTRPGAAKRNGRRRTKAGGPPLRGPGGKHHSQERWRGMDADQLRQEMAQCIFAKGGEISSKAKAAELGTRYRKLTREDRETFLRILATDFDVDPGALTAEIDRLNAAVDPAQRIDAELSLAEALTPPRMHLLRQLDRLPNGLKLLIDMRGDARAMANGDARLKKLAADLKGLLSAWFDVGLLDLREITWDSPASLLEKVMKYEAVNKITSWKDMKHRVYADRRCFAYFHNKVPNEPLIFLEVALVQGLADNVQEILDPDAPQVKPQDADTAMFYGISSTQEGLAGVNLGNFLIKRVVQELSNELPDLKHFATLSPMAGFRKWLDKFLPGAPETVPAADECRAIRELSGEDDAKAGVLKLLDTDWYTDADIRAALERPLMRLAARYLLIERRGNKALDPVANFHLTNGARLERINWLANTSDRGVRNSACIMVNYYYDRDDIVKNHEAYVTESRIVASKAVRAWLDG